MAPLRQLRRQRALTQEQLAASADVSPSTVYHIEAGKVHPRPSIVRRLARALDGQPNDLTVDALHNTAEPDRHQGRTRE